jgi:hypothetical protein
MKKIVIALVLTLGFSTTGCLGPNHAFNGIQNWNAKVSNKWVNELLHIGMWVIPVYQVTLLGDVLIFNSVEWWGGKNPIDAPGAFPTQSGK